MSTLVTILLAIVMQVLGSNQAQEKSSITALKQQNKITKSCDSFPIIHQDTSVYHINQPSKNEQDLNENNTL